jgi:hypothetical protein
MAAGLHEKVCVEAIAVEAFEKKSSSDVRVERILSNPTSRIHFALV